MEERNNVNFSNDIIMEENKNEEEKRLIYEEISKIKMNSSSKEKSNIDLEKDSYSEFEKTKYGDDIIRLRAEIEELLKNIELTSKELTKKNILESMDKQSIIQHIMANDIDDYIEQQIKNSNDKKSTIENKNDEKKEFINLSDLAATVYSHIDLKKEQPIKEDENSLHIDSEEFLNSLIDFCKDEKKKTYIVNDKNGNIVKYNLSYDKIKDFIKKLQYSCQYVLNSKVGIINEKTEQEKSSIKQQDSLKDVSSLFRKTYPWMKISSVLPPIERIVNDYDKKEEMMDDISNIEEHIHTFSYDGEENELGNIVITLENGEKIAVPNGIDPTVPGSIFSNEDGSVTYTIGEVNEEKKPVIKVEVNDVTKKSDDTNSDVINPVTDAVDTALGGKK